MIVGLHHLFIMMIYFAFSGSVVVYDKNDKDTLWVSVIILIVNVAKLISIQKRYILSSILMEMNLDTIPKY